MDSVEEQELELEALGAIFMDDFAVEDAASAAAGARFRVTLSEGEVRVRLSFANPPDYPDAATAVAVTALAALSAPRRKALQQAVARAAAAAVPAPAAYAVCEAARDWLVDHVVVGTAEDAADADADADADRFETIDSSSRSAVETVAAKLVGTPVTPESFAAWREKFVAEIAARDRERASAKRAGLKMTGREMFEARVAVVSADSEAFWEMEAEGFDEHAG